MVLSLTEDLIAIQATARNFAQARLAPNAARWDEQKIFPEAELKEAAALGLAAIYVGEDVGGSGLNRLAAALIFEELSAACVSTAAFISIHNMAGWMIDRFGTPEQRRRYLPDMCRMAKIASYCLTEPGGLLELGLGEDLLLIPARGVRRQARLREISRGRLDGDHILGQRQNHFEPPVTGLRIHPAAGPGNSLGPAARRMGFRPVICLGVLPDIGWKKPHSNCEYIPGRVEIDANRSRRYRSVSRRPRRPL